MKFEKKYQVKKIVSIILLFLIQFAQSQSLYTERKDIEKQINDASSHFREAEYEKALELSKKALVRSFKINDDYLIAHSYNSIGVIYDEFSESKRAIEYYNKALQYSINIENDSLLDWVYSNLGSVYYYNKIDVTKGIAYYNKSLQYAEKIKDSSQIVYTKLNIASAYFSVDDYETGIKAVNEVKDFVEKKGEQEAKFTFYALEGIYNGHLNNVAVAEAFYKKAISIGEANAMTSFLANVYENYANDLKRFKKFKEAAFYRNKFVELNNKIHSEEKLNSLDDAALQIELDENKSQLEKIEMANEHQKKKIEESNIISVLFSAIVIVLLLFIYSLYKNNNSRKRLNAELTISNAELKQAKEIAEEASLLKTQFISTISHELRTPLYGVIGLTDILIEEDSKNANNSHLKSLKFSAKYLLSLVNDLLQINKIEETRKELDATVFNLSDEIKNTKNSFSFLANKNKNKITLNIDPNIPEFLLGDKLKLSQILMNLTSNALKFTKKGEVNIAAFLEKVEAKKHFIKFIIKDTGIGIHKDNQDKIFEKFVQVNRNELDYQGTGLGLSIVKSLIALFDSKIYIESHPGDGTTFTFTIPFEFDEEKIKAVVNNMDFVVDSGQVFKILIVEDNKINQIVTKKIIDKSNFVSKVVDGGYEALEILEKENFDAILMDINMPDINGFETTRLIREKGIQTPIIALTAFDKNEISDEATASGMNDIIIKPFEASKLFQIINNQINSLNNKE